MHVHDIMILFCSVKSLIVTTSSPMSHLNWVWIPELTAGLNPNAAEFRPNMWSCLAAGDGWWLFGKVALSQKVLEENTQIQMVYHHFAFEK